MPSSTSSFERVIPDRSWLRMAAVSAALATLLLAGWEILARKRGFEPTLDDVPELWAQARRAFDAAPRDGIVLVGSSRMLFDFDLDVAEQALGVRPIELALPGSNELAGLEHVAADATFHGTVLVSYVPMLTFLPPDAAPRGRLCDGGRTDTARREQIRAAWRVPAPPSHDPLEQQSAERETVRQQVLW